MEPIEAGVGRRGKEEEREGERKEDRGGKERRGGKRGGPSMDFIAYPGTSLCFFC